MEVINVASIQPNIIKRDFSIMKFLGDHATTIEKVGGARIAAMIHIKGSDSYVGVNSSKTDPLQARFGKNKHAINLHAEIHSIKIALRSMHVDDLSKATLYICRAKHINSRDNTWMWGLASPCSGCRRAIEEFNINRIVYSLNSHKNEYAVEERH